MNAEFIYRPISGEYPEKHFGKTTSNCLWVKFVNNNGLEWVASFEESWVENEKHLINIKEENKVFIVADGQTYLIDINTRELLNKKEFSDTKTVILDIERKKIYFSDGYDLKFMDYEGNYSVIYNENHFDEIRLLNVSGNKLSAIYWNYQTSNQPFKLEIDLDTKEVKDSYDSYIKPNLIQKLSKWIKK